MKKIFILTIILFYANYSCLAQAGTLDSSFGKNGVSVAVLPSSSLYSGNQLAIQNDGKIIIRSNFAEYLLMARLNTNGTLDATFGTNGSVKIRLGVSVNSADNFSAILVQPDNKIVIGGITGAYKNDTAGLILSRFNSDGTLDKTFNGGSVVFNPGLTFTGIAELALQADGKIIESENNYLGSQGGKDIADFAIVRFNTNGTVDSSFGINGITYTDMDNGYLNSLARCTAVQPDGKILEAGISFFYRNDTTKFCLVRYNTNGTRDSTFGTKGEYVFPAKYFQPSDLNAVQLQQDGKILMGGYYSATDTSHTQSYFLLRLNADGKPDSSFGVNGEQENQFSNINSYCTSTVLEKDGKIIQAGGAALSSASTLVVRYNTDGSLDSTFGAGGKIMLPEVQGATMVIQSDGKIDLPCAGDSDGLFVIRILTGLSLGVLNFNTYQPPVLVYPNPINSCASLRYTLIKNENISICLIDMQGKLVQTFFTSQNREASEHTETLNFTTALSSGDYILNISNSTGTQGVKVTLQR